MISLSEERGKDKKYNTKHKENPKNYTIKKILSLEYALLYPESLNNIIKSRAFGEKNVSSVKGNVMYNTLCQ